MGFPSSVRPELVEGPSFDTPGKWSRHEVRCFDKLSTNGGRVRFAVAALALCATTPAHAQSADATVDAIIAPLAKPDAPGCAVAADRGGKRIATQAFGFADLEHGVLNTTDTVFEAGSVSKQFTAAAVLLLVEDGKMKLTDDIRTYLPEMPDYGTPITIDMLLSHTSGLRDWGVVAGVTGWPRGTRAYTNEDALRIAAAQRSLNYPPGSEYSYTNTGYNLLALIVGRVSGQSLAAFTEARLFDKLGMRDTQWRDDFQRIVKDRAIAYVRGDDGRYSEFRPFESDYGNGGLLTTVGDLMTWNAALTSGILGARVTARLQERATLTSGQRIAYARGLVVMDYKGVATVNHGGATGGYRAWLERLPASGLSIAVLCNGGNFNTTAIGRALADKLLALREAPVKRFAATGLETRSGMWANTADGAAMWIDLADGGLKLRDGPALTPVARNRFQSASGRFVFGKDDLIYTDNGGQPYRFARATPADPAAPLGGYEGTYVAPEAGGARYSVKASGGTLVLQLLDRVDPMFAAPIVLKPTYKDAFEDGDGTVVRFEPQVMVLGMPRMRALRFVKR